MYKDLSALPHSATYRTTIARHNMTNEVRDMIATSITDMTNCCRASQRNRHRAPRTRATHILPLHNEASHMACISGYGCQRVQARMFSQRSLFSSCGWTGTPPLQLHNVFQLLFKPHSHPFFVVSLNSIFCLVLFLPPVCVCVCVCGCVSLFSFFFLSLIFSNPL